MMRPKQIVLTAAGTSQAVPIDYWANGYAIGITASAGGARYTLQHTFASPWSNNLNTNGSGPWLNCDDSLVVNASGNRNTNYAFTPQALRLLVLSARTGTDLVWTIIANGVTP